MTSLAEDYACVRRRTEALCATLSAEDCGAQSMPDASPAKWHLAHTTWFFETFVLRVAELSFQAHHPAFEYLFNSYYDSVGSRHPRPSRGLLTRPSLTEVLEYRAAVDRRMAVALADPRHAAAITLGLAHEEQHQELLVTDVLHLFAQNPLSPSLWASVPAEHSVEEGFRRYEEGLHWIGAPESGFAFDNERPRHRQFVAAFELAPRLVTAREYRAFIADGGYSRPELWSSEGHALAQSERWRAPLHWRADGGLELEMTVAGLVPLDLDAPVGHVSYFEADAYARWASARLPTEAEWEVATQGPPLPQLFGSRWQWTSSAYAPYPGFRPLAGAFGEYNGKFMVNQYVLRGSSVATPAGHSRSSYRNFFPASARWQFSGIRLARDLR